MTHSTDIPLEAPSLMTIASQSIDSAMFDSEFMKDVYLPLAVSTALFDGYRMQWNEHPAQPNPANDNGEDENDKIEKQKKIRHVIRTWCDSSRLPLSKLDLTGAIVSDRLLVDIMKAHQHAITELDLTNVQGPTDEANAFLDAQNVHFPNLISVKMTSMELLSKPQPRRKNGMAQMEYRNSMMLGVDALEEAAPAMENIRDRGRDFHPFYLDSNIATTPQSPQPSSQSDDSIDEKEDIMDREFPVFTSRCPNVKCLLLPKTKKSQIEDENDVSTNAVLSKVFDPLYQLEKLDLSYWSKLDDLRCIHPLHQTLTTLVLYDVPDLYHAVPTITQMAELRYLDISQSQRETAIYPRPVSILNQLITSLPKLTHLDISSTNLASQPSANDWPLKSNDKKTVRSDIVGLQSLETPLIFLGLFNCDNASHFLEIPAEHISGDANEDQVITSLKMYKERSGLLQSVLNESYQLYRFGNSTPLVRHTEALHLVLDAMQRHLSDSTLQIAGSASLFYIIRKVEMNRDTKKRVVSALLSGMEVHMEEQVMVRNCCLSLCQFEIPQDILFDYSRLAVLLVTVLQHHNADNLTQRIVVFLLNSMACHVEGDQKVQVGSFGAIEMILDQISRKHTGNTCDDVMEVGWSFLWNITDETPVNCERFLNAKGLDLFQKCYEAFKSERELVRNMMGLIGNIAEVDELRSQLMNDDYVKIFCALLETQEDSIEISYNSAGVLAHMVSDGEEVWKKLTISRDDVMASIVKATDGWKLATRRFINYRSFRPILRLLPLYHAYASQHWAVWALANLTTTDGEKYCAYVRDEGGLPLLEELVVNVLTTPEIRALARRVLDNMRETEMRRSREPLDTIAERMDEEPMEVEA